ncbi:MAG: secretin N-terminal domain-containing protein [Chthoniobacterales bacterium]
MSIRPNPFACAAAALLGALSFSHAQVTPPESEPITGSLNAVPPAPVVAAPIAPAPATSATMSDGSTMTLVQGNTAPVPAVPATTATSTTTTTTETPLATEGAPAADLAGVGVREFQGDEVGQVLRLLARQAKVNMVVSEAVVGTVTMRLEDVTALQAVEIIAKSKSLFVDKIDGVYYVKTAAERTAEPTEADSYQFSYARAKEIEALLGGQLASKAPAQVDERTNTIFYSETRSNIDNIRRFLVQIDRPTKQVMIEARLVEVNANPKQSYGINWAGVVGSSSNAQTFRYGATSNTANSSGGLATTEPSLGNSANPNLFNSSLGNLVTSQFAILTVPQLSVTLRALNEDADTEFLANPRIVTADNMQAKIEITRNQPVPQLNFNEQTATAVFGGFQDKKFGNTLIVKPLVNKDDFITLSVKPEISNKVGDATFVFAGATVASPVIDTRSLDSNVLIKSGDTLAIGGLLQDEQTKARTKVPILGDIPVLGYLFQEKLNARTKRNLLVFVTPTIIDQHYGTGLEDQISGVHHSGEEFADPNGWRNNAKGAVRIIPTSNRQLAADYPKPGTPPAPARTGGSKVRFMADAKDREF